MDVAADGTFVVRTDTYGAWIWEREAAAWRQLVTIDSMPPEDRNEDSSATSWPLDLVIAPSLTRRLYMGLDGWLYRSDDAGRNWVRTGFPRVEGMGGVANESKVNGRKIAVDPHDPDTVYVGSPQDPLRVTHDGGRTWRAIAGLPLAGTLGGERMGHLTIVDPTSPRLNGRAAVVYTCPWGAGVHRSVDGGASWAPLPGAPSSLRHAAIDGNGTLYVVSGAGMKPAQQIHRFDGRWTNISPPNASAEAWHSITVSPHAAGRILVGKIEGSLCESLDGGRTWQRPIHRTAIRRSADDVPWLAWTDETWMSNGDIRFDPANPDRILFAQGIGVWHAGFAPRAQDLRWVSQSRNIEQLVCNQCVHPPEPDGVPLLACWDRGIWRVTDPDAYPSHHGPDRTFTHCWGIDYAEGHAGFLVATMSSQQATDRDRSGHSTDGGRTWQTFRSLPPWAQRTSGKGFMAASTPANLVWAPGEGRGLPHYTRDGGASWRACSIAGLTDLDAAGFGAPSYIRRYPLCADRVAVGTFYLVHHPAGLFASVDGGENWTLRHSFKGWVDRFHAKLRAVPGQSGHLFYTAGHSSADRHGPFLRSQDGGRTWSSVPGVREVADFAFGKAAPDTTYPALYIAGYVAGLWGIYRSQDAGASWSRLGDRFPLGSLDRICAIEADKATFGRIYVGFAGSGWACGQG
jgi:photosystem II stability/assembly factor-like uncharacterized protein